MECHSDNEEGGQGTQNEEGGVAIKLKFLARSALNALGRHELFGRDRMQCGETRVCKDTDGVTGGWQSQEI